MLGDAATGAVLYQGKLTLYKHVTDAIAVFESLPPEEAIPKEALADLQSEDDDEDLI